MRIQWNRNFLSGSPLPPSQVLLSMFILMVASTYFLYIWVGYSEAWFSPLVIRGAAYIWTPNSQSVWDLLLKSLDWAALDTPDPTKYQEFLPAHRVRPLSDFAQVIDSISRPWISKLYPHPSLTPSALVAGIFTPLFFYLFVRRVGNCLVMAALLTALLISSMGFLSVIIPDIHAGAKRLSLLLICVSLYLAANHESNNRKFFLLLAVLFLSLFTDEMALGLYVAIVMLFAHSFFATRAKAFAILSLPLFYLAATNWGLPELYTMANNDMPYFDAIGDKRKMAVLLHLKDTDFYLTALSQTARAILTTIGISKHNFFTEASILTTLVCISVWLKWQGHRQIASSAGALLANGLYLTLIDLYNPEDFYSQVPTYADYNIFLASYAYYYHSSLSILTLVWMLFVFRALFQYRILAFAAVPVAAVIALNFYTFHNVNQLVALAHYYPFESSSLYEKIRQIGFQYGDKSRGIVVPVKVISSCSIVTSKFTRIFEASMGNSWQTNPLNRYFQKGSFTNEDLGHLFFSHFPQYKFDIQIESDGSGCGVPLTVVAPEAGPSGSKVLVSGTGFQAYVEISFFWDSGSGILLGRTIADRNGNFANIPLQLPVDTLGPHKILASSYTGLALSDFNLTQYHLIR